MALMRGFSKVDEEGRITIPAEIARFSELDPGTTAHMIVLRILETARFPHLVIHKPHNIPYISMLEVILTGCQDVVDERKRVRLPVKLLEALRLEPGFLVEFKIHGARGQHWVVVHNRGPHRMSTLQERTSRYRRLAGARAARRMKNKEERWKKYEFGY